ncbi:hypothetical protein [Haloterrigena salinisoli]|uniref:hypothetical protein n=1 Tax=Haloterrigena salinisoli TaxID=3132747 RepID=UPI0030D30147
MRFKPVPDPPADLERVAPILEAVPATAGAVDDCCGRLVDETRLESRDAAETWLVFLRALDLATEESEGYRRVAATSEPGQPIDPATLQQPFRDRVYGADAVLEVLERAETSLSVADVSDAVHDERPGLERGSRSDRRERGRGYADDPHERVRRLLEWADLLGLAARTADGDRYRSASDLA